MGCSLGINCVAVSEAFLASLFSLLVAFGLLLINDWRKERKWKPKKAKLLELAVRRAEAIRIRNEGEKKNLRGEPLKDWVRRAKAAEQAMVDKATEVDDLDGHLIDWQDRPAQIAYPKIKAKEQKTYLRHLSGAIIRAEVVLSKYRV